MDIKDKKYRVSLKSITPLPTLSKCVIGLRSCSRFAVPLGSVIATISNPIIISTILNVRPNIKATIWFLVKLDVNNPIETRQPARKILAIYCDMTAPQSKFPAVVNDNGIAKVDSTAIDTKIRPDKNFVTKTTHARIG